MNAVCLLGIVPVRAKPGDREEMVTQLLYGETVEILDRKGSWLHIKGHADGYAGWVDRLQLTETEEVEPARYVVTTALTRLSGQWLPMGSLLRSAAPSATGATATRPATEPAGADFIVELARQFLQAPYLWGGKTVLGVDCSGLTQTVYCTAGFSLPRDSSEQARCGRETSLAAGRPADLAFFSKPGAPDRVTHVGLVVPAGDGWRVIHASGRVREDKLDDSGIWNGAGELTHELLSVRRIVP